MTVSMLHVKFFLVKLFSPFRRSGFLLKSFRCISALSHRYWRIFCATSVENLIFDPKSHPKFLPFTLRYFFPFFSTSSGSHRFSTSCLTLREIFMLILFHTQGDGVVYCSRKFITNPTALVSNSLKW